MTHLCGGVQHNLIQALMGRNSKKGTICAKGCEPRVLNNQQDKSKEAQSPCRLNYNKSVHAFKV